MTIQDMINCILTFTRPDGSRWRVKDIAAEIGRDAVTITRIRRQEGYTPSQPTIDAINRLYDRVCNNPGDYII